MNTTQDSFLAPADSNAVITTGVQGTKVLFTNAAGEQIAKLWEENGRLRFEGAADEAAQQFIGLLQQLWNQR